MVDGCITNLQTIQKANQTESRRDHDHVVTTPRPNPNPTFGPQELEVNPKAAKPLPKRPSTTSKGPVDELKKPAKRDLRSTVSDGVFSLPPQPAQMIC